MEWLFFLLLAAVAAYCDDAADVRFQPGQTAPGAEISFKLYRHYLVVVPVSVEDLQNLSFAVDTGSGRTIIDQRVAKRLKLSGRQTRLTAVNTTVDVLEGTVANLKVGPAVFDSVSVLVRDLGFLRKPLGARVDGIVGLDLLARSSFSLDYAAHKLVLGDCVHGDFRVPFAASTPLIGVRLHVAGRPVHLLVDTAASEMQVFARSILERVTLRRREAFGVAGNLLVTEVLLPSARLGNDDLGPLHTYVVHGEAGETRDFDGLLSPVALGFTRMCFDFPRREFSWSR